MQIFHCNKEDGIEKMRLQVRGDCYGVVGFLFESRLPIVN